MMMEWIKRQKAYDSPAFIRRRKYVRNSIVLWI